MQYRRFGRTGWKVSELGRHVGTRRRTALRRLRIAHDAFSDRRSRGLAISSTRWAYGEGTSYAYLWKSPARQRRQETLRRHENSAHEFTFTPMTHPRKLVSLVRLVAGTTCASRAAGHIERSYTPKASPISVVEKLDLIHVSRPWKTAGSTRTPPPRALSGKICHARSTAKAEQRCRAIRRQSHGSLSCRRHRARRTSFAPSRRRDRPARRP